LGSLGCTRCGAGKNIVPPSGPNGIVPMWKFFWTRMSPVEKNALHTPHVSATNTLGTNARALRIAPIRPVSLVCPAFFALDIAEPPSMIPASASTGAPNANTNPSFGIGVVRTPTPAQTTASADRRIDKSPMARTW
jgi:hypothetical protein